MLTFEPWTDAMALHVCRNMRAIDAREVFAIRHDDSPYGLYADLRAVQPAALWLELARPMHKMRPIALYGVVRSGPGVGTAIMFAVDGVSDEQLVGIARRIRQDMIPALLKSDLHRVEALSLFDHPAAHRFMKFTGAQIEGTRWKLGKNGEDLLSFVWLRKELEHVRI